MKKIKRIKNNLSEIIMGKITQKDLAKKVNVTEATLSDFLNMKRSTINIDLLNSILTEMSISITPEDDFASLIERLNPSISDIFSIVETFELELYEENKYNKSPTSDNVYFCYSNNPNNSFVETIEILDDGRVLTTHLNIPIEEFTPENIAKRFKQHESPENVALLMNNKIEPLVGNFEEIAFVDRFISLARYEGKVKDLLKYADKNQAIETIEMLYL